MNEQTTRIRPALVRKLKSRSQKSWKRIAKECHIHLGTIKRWLAGEAARMENVELLANALGTTAENIKLLKNEKDLTDYADTEVVKEGDIKLFEKHVSDFVSALQKAAGTKRPMLIVYISPGSIRIGLKLHQTDLLRVITSLTNGQLNSLQIISVKVLAEQAIPSDLIYFNERLIRAGYGSISQETLSLLPAALDKTKTACEEREWRPFEETFLKGSHPKQVADNMGVTPGYILDRRRDVLKLIKKELAQLWKNRKK